MTSGGTAPNFCSFVLPPSPPEEWLVGFDGFENPSFLDNLPHTIPPARSE